MDVDNLLRYMAVHVFSVNDDSLTGMMAHNYYLYESDGQLNIIPWDYNLALGGMGSTGGMNGESADAATSVVNDAIDQAFSGTQFFDTLMEIDEYHQAYYSYLSQLVEEYIFGGGFDEFYTRTRSQIDELVETDPNAFYTYDEYITAVETLYEVVQLRGESIRGQVDGSIPSVESDQRGSDTLIDASHLDLSVMGSMSMGDGLLDFNFNGDENSIETAPTNEAEPNNKYNDNLYSGVTNTESYLPTSSKQDINDSFDFSQFGDDFPENFDPSQFGGDSLPEGFAPSNENESSEDAVPSPSDTTTQENSQGGTETDGHLDDSSSIFPDSFENMGNIPNIGTGSASSNTTNNIFLYGVCFAVLIAALVFAKLYHRPLRRR